MAAVTAQISSIKRVDGQLVAYCSVDHGPAFSAIIPRAGGEYYPIAGDTVTAVQSGKEWHVVSIFCEGDSAGEGEHLFFSRDSLGAVSSFVHIKADGTVLADPALHVGRASDFVAMAQKVDSSIDAIANAISGAATGSADGGAAFKLAIVTALNISLPAIGSVASRNLKAE